jgi:hypothetical protein
MAFIVRLLPAGNDMVIAHSIAAAGLHGFACARLAHSDRVRACQKIAQDHAPRARHDFMQSDMGIAQAQQLALVLVSHDGGQWARNALAACVLCRTKRSRLRKAMARACQRGDFGATNLLADSAMAFASFVRLRGATGASVLPTIILLAFYKRLDIGRRHQPDIVPKIVNLTCKVVGRGTGFHGHNTGAASP